MYPCKFNVSTWRREFWFEVSVLIGNVKWKYQVYVEPSKFKLGIWASSVMSRRQKHDWRFILTNWSGWNFKNLTEFPFTDGNFSMEFRSYKRTLEWHFQHQVETWNLHGYAWCISTVMIGDHYNFLHRVMLFYCFFKTNFERACKSNFGFFKLKTNEL